MFCWIRFFFTCFLGFSVASFAYPSYQNNISTHYAMGVDPQERILILEDGSGWKVSSWDSYVLFSWHSNDRIAITPNCLTYSDFTYYITNQENGSYVKANLMTSPVRGGPYAVTIASLDTHSYYRGSLYLDNGTCWAVCTEDLSLIRNWFVGDLVILGKNSEWFSFHPYILINIHTNTFVRVRSL